MLLQTILNHVHPVKGFVYQTVKRVKDTEDIYIVKVIARKNSKGICPKCKKKCPGYDTLDERLFEFIPIFNIPIRLAYSRRRVDCKTHGKIAEYLPWVYRNEHTTIAFQVFLAQWARLLSWQEVSRRFNTTWDTVWLSIANVVEYGLANRTLTNITSIGFDEIAYGVGHGKYLTVCYQIDAFCKRLLWVGQDRTTKTILRFFMDFGKERSAHIKYVCTDMWKPYLKVIAKKIPQALNILDRFHIMKKFNEAIDKVRRKEVYTLQQKGKEPVLTNRRWILLKRQENLSIYQKGSLRELLKCNLQSVRAYLLKEEFQLFWSYSSPFWAGKFLNEWIRKTMLSKIEPMKRVAQMLKRHRSLLLNWFIARGKLSSGIVEALNGTAKMTMKRSYGFRTYDTVKYALYHKLGDLPLPKLTHKFF